MTNSARWVTWKYAAVPPPGEARLDQDIVAQIFLRVRDLYKKEGGKFPDPILNLSWAYADAAASVAFASGHGAQRQSAGGHEGRHATRKWSKPASNCRVLHGCKDDGTTMCGNWIYSGMLDRGRTADADGAARKIHRAWAFIPNWSWSWPANRRVLYNRASCDLDGKPWDPERKQVWWNEAAGKWAGNDVPDFKPDSHPKDHMGPFIMNPEGVGPIVRADRSAGGRAVPGTLRADRKPDSRTCCIRSNRIIRW